MSYRTSPGDYVCFLCFGIALIEAIPNGLVMSLLFDGTFISIDDEEAKQFMELFRFFVVWK